MVLEKKYMSLYLFTKTTVSFDNVDNFESLSWKLDNPYYHNKDESDDDLYHSDEDEYYEYNSEDETEIDG